MEAVRSGQPRRREAWTPRDGTTRAPSSPRRSAVAAQCRCLPLRDDDDRRCVSGRWPFQTGIPVARDDGTPMMSNIERLGANQTAWSHAGRFRGLAGSTDVSSRAPGGSDQAQKEIAMKAHEDHHAADCRARGRDLRVRSRDMVTFADVRFRGQQLPLSLQPTGSGGRPLVADAWPSRTRAKRQRSRPPSAAAGSTQVEHRQDRTRTQHAAPRTRTARHPAPARRTHPAHSTRHPALAGQPSYPSPVPASPGGESPA
jgi:hypothetical protein